MTSAAHSVNPSLRKLYLTRTAFQVLWAVLLFTLGQGRPALAAALVVLYPLWDVACTVYDLRSSHGAPDTRASQTANAVLGTVTALGIALSIGHNAPLAIALFGGWALAAGLLQLVAGLLRRKQLGGQWAMMLSGAQSAVAGVTFVLGGLRGRLHARDLGGYALFGAFYFLVSAVLMRSRDAHSVAKPILS